MWAFNELIKYGDQKINQNWFLLSFTLGGKPYSAKSEIEEDW